MAYKTVYISDEVDVDIDLEEFDDDELIDEVNKRALGRHCNGRIDPQTIDQLRRALYRNEDLKPLVEALLHQMGYIV